MHSVHTLHFLDNIILYLTFALEKKIVMERLMKIFEGLKMTIVSGVVLLLSLILLLSGIKVVFDPAWLTIIISGLPLLYHSSTRLIVQHWLSSAMVI